MNNYKNQPKNHAFSRNNNYENDNFPRKKKALGQHFLRKQSVVDNMINKVQVSENSTILEIGCGDGFLTQAILRQTKCKNLFSYEIDKEWADFVRERIRDKRLSVVEQNILEVELENHREQIPLTLLANLPYQITFPIFFMLVKNKNLFAEGVVMIQEEVAQKMVAKRGKSHNSTTIFLQHHFELELMEKIEPQAFDPAPKVFSRLIYFKPKNEVLTISDQENFWKFLKLCFKQPRRTLRNNLQVTPFDLTKFSEQFLASRAQQLTINDFISEWQKLI